MENEFKLILVIGAPGSGKSTFAQKLIESDNSLYYLSSDALRAELGTSEEDQSVTPLVFTTLKHRLNRALSNRTSTIIDATNINRRDRKDYIVAAKAAGAKVIGFVFECDKKTLMDRNQKRGAGGGRNVPEFVIDKMLAKYERPSKIEGFDEIYFK